MRKPLTWNRLEEAADWLTEYTGEAWNQRRVLDAALRFPYGENPYRASNLCTAVGAALHKENEIFRTILDVDEGREKLDGIWALSYQGAIKAARESGSGAVKISKCYRRPVALLQSEVRQMLEANFVELSAARNWHIDHEPYELYIIDPPFVASIDDLGFSAAGLIYLAESFKKANEGVSNIAAQSSASGNTVPKKWARGLKLVAWECAHTISRDGKMLNASSLDACMRDDSRVIPSGSTLQYGGAADASLKRGEDEVNVSTLSNWVTAIKREITQNS